MSAARQAPPIAQPRQCLVAVRCAEPPTGLVARRIAPLSPILAPAGRELSVFSVVSPLASSPAGSVRFCSESAALPRLLRPRLASSLWSTGGSVSICSEAPGEGVKPLAHSCAGSTAATTSAASGSSSPQQRSRSEELPVSSALLRCCELLEGLADRLDDRMEADEAECRREAASAALRSALAQARELASSANEHFQSEGRAACVERPDQTALARAAEAALRAARDRLAACIAEARDSGVVEAELQPAESQRRDLHSLVQDLRGLVRIYCRVRPMTSREVQAGETKVLSVHGGTAVEMPGYGRFSFDAVFSEGTPQEEVFEEARDLAQSALDGHNVTVLAYGQTGTGKTHTMFGAPGEDGLAVRMARDLFDRIGDRRITVTGSLVEMHRNCLVDLLAAAPDRGVTRPSLGLRRRDADMDEVHIDGAVEWPIRSATGLVELVRVGTSRRTVAAHSLNGESSRSHAFLTVRVLSAVGGPAGTGVDSKLMFCDLAGSERLKRSEVSGEHAREAIDTNSSLSALGDVIEAIVHRRRHIPYRNHKLTQLLQDSLGGSAKALIFATCSPASGSAHETAMALKFVARANRVSNYCVAFAPRRVSAAASSRS